MPQTTGISTQDALAGFTSMINSYEHRVGHATRAVAGHLPSLLTSTSLCRNTLIQAQNPLIHDNACGTGAVTEKLIQALPACRIYATDSMPPMIQAYKAVMTNPPNSHWKSNVVDVSVMDGQELRFEDSFFDASIMNFGIFFFPDARQGVKEIHRTLKPGGVAIVTLWKSIGFAPILWEVQRRIVPENPLTELPIMEPWFDGRLLRETMEEGGFSSNEVELRIVEERMWGNGFEDFLSVLLENFGAMVSSNWSDGEKDRLAEVTREVLGDGGDGFCVKGDGGRIGVPMVAWVAICTK